MALLVAGCSAEEAPETVKVVSDRLPPPPPPPTDYSMFKPAYADTSCQNERRQARQDAQNGWLVYVSAFNGKFQRYDDELKELLAKEHIRYRPIGMNCTSYNLCYGYYMDSLIAARHGTHFLDSMGRVADRLYQARWATRTYDYFHVDTIPNCCAIGPEAYVLSKLKLPRGMDQEPSLYERQHASVELVVDSVGTVSDIRVGRLGFNLKKRNQKYAAYLKRHLKSIVQAMGPWQPAMLNGHRVKCWYQIDVNLDKEEKEPVNTAPAYLRRYGETVI
jgi:hypothetical protein